MFWSKWWREFDSKAARLFEENLKLANVIQNSLQFPFARKFMTSSNIVLHFSFESTISNSNEATFHENVSHFISFNWNGFFTSLFILSLYLQFTECLSIVWLIGVCVMEYSMSFYRATMPRNGSNVFIYVYQVNFNVKSNAFYLSLCPDIVLVFFWAFCKSL